MSPASDRAWSWLAGAVVVLVLAKTVRIVPQARAGIVERFGKYKRDPARRA